MDCVSTMGPGAAAKQQKAPLSEHVEAFNWGGWTAYPSLWDLARQGTQDGGCRCIKYFFALLNDACLSVNKKRQRRPPNRSFRSQKRD